MATFQLLPNREEKEVDKNVNGRDTFSMLKNVTKIRNQSMILTTFISLLHFWKSRLKKP